MRLPAVKLELCVIQKLKSHLTNYILLEGIVDKARLTTYTSNITEEVQCSSRFGKEVKLNLGTMHGDLPLVNEDFSPKKSFMDFTSTVFIRLKTALK